MENSDHLSTEGSVSWNGLACLGATHLLDGPKTVILNSSQGKQPTGDLPWVNQTLRVVESLAREDAVLFTSIGLNTWELACWAAGGREVSQVVGVPDAGDRSPETLYRELINEFKLDPDRTCAVFVPSKKNRPKSWWETRDEALISAADRIIPVSIRSGGRIENLVKSRSASSLLDERFRVPWSPAPETRSRFKFDTERIRCEVDLQYDGWLTHWTRSADGSWPGETKADYYQALTASLGEYSRSARTTLERIETEKRIRASTWRIRDKTPVVSFTALPPSAATRLMRWRSRYARFTIEPYGLAIRKEAAAHIGVRPVFYLPDTQAAPKSPIHLQQFKGSKGEWPIEQEHRLAGDLDLNSLPADSWKRIDLTPFLLEKDD